MRLVRTWLTCALGGLMAVAADAASRSLADHRSVSGIYPHLAMFNDEGECGTGAVVPWAGRLWVVTYAPHKPSGSSDKLYEITPSLQQIVRPESIGGTPANRMIHRESSQLFIGPYAIAADGGVRVIPYERMFGRPTGNARHLTDPAGKIYAATMEEGLYEIDVKSLAVSELWADEQRKTGRHADLPGYHGKGLYSGFGRIIYANNGDHAQKALTDPTVPSGVLAEWDGKATAWNVVRRNQFTEVTGPGGIYGNERPGTDPIWSIGWDHRSLILMLLGGGRWQAFRLPKASHSYDGAHGWNTEWPRICDVGQGDLLMTMHGMFWRFPRGFDSTHTAGIRPRSAYLKVIGDFCAWNDRLVFGCDDSAKSEFLNKRKAKGDIEGPGQSQSNLWFTDPETPDQLGPTLAEGAVWLRDAVKQGESSEPFLFAGWSRRSAHFINGGSTAAVFSIEVDRKGNGVWASLRDVEVPAGNAAWIEFDAKDAGEWVRIKSGADCPAATVHFTFSNPETRGTSPDRSFSGLAKISELNKADVGLLRARGANLKTLAFASAAGVYREMDGSLALKPVDDAAARAFVVDKVAIPKGAVAVESSSVLVVDDRGRRWRLPRTDAAYDEPTASGKLRICREVATERDLFNVHGTFFELPAENADGFAKIRPIASHGFGIVDYCSYRGLMVLSGVKSGAKAGDHIVRSSDGAAGLWVGAIDDLWKLGRPVGNGGPWDKTDVKAGQPSDPYLIWGYERRRATLSADAPAQIRVEVDPTGDGLWVLHKSVAVRPGRAERFEFPPAFQARWVRFVSDKDCRATASLRYD